MQSVLCSAWVLNPVACLFAEMREPPPPVPPPDIGALREVARQIAGDLILSKPSAYLSYPSGGTSSRGSSSSEPALHVDFDELAKVLRVLLLLPKHNTCEYHKHAVLASLPQLLFLTVPVWPQMQKKLVKKYEKLDTSPWQRPGVDFGVVMYDDSAFASAAPTRLEGTVSFQRTVQEECV